MNRDLTIITRTCSNVYALHGSRYVNKSKHEIINVCLSSLVNSINMVKNHSIKLIVLDDHSDDTCLTDIKHILSRCKYPSELISVEGGTGAKYTCYKVYEQIEKHANDLWLHIEDDYLSFPEMIQDLIDSVEQFELNTEKMIAINPHDDIWRYTRQIYDSILLLGPYRHYRTVKHSTYTCLASRKIYNKYKSYFQESAKWILQKSEDETINKVWQRDDVMLFSPIPSLSLHLMDESGKDPYIDWEKLWNETPKLWKNN